MKIISLPKTINALIFDIDQTLYDNLQYSTFRKQSLIRRFADEVGKTQEKAENEIRDIREKAAALGEHYSLTRVFMEFNISFDTVVKWREELYNPEEYLTYDPELVNAIKALSKKMIITAITNNPTVIGKRTLCVLGVEDYFHIIIGLEISGRSKPTMIPFHMISDQLDIPLNEMITIGDRLEIDIELPVKNGMGGILVENLNDIYLLPSLLENLGN